jgi:hypothetical protein
MRLLHALGKIHAAFDDPHLVLRAGLVPVMALAQRAGLRRGPCTCPTMRRPPRVADGDV